MNDLLRERGSTHGNFKDNALVSQSLEDVMRAGTNWNALKPFQKEALKMIAHKIGRILSGDPDFEDHWDDLSGYGALPARILRGEL